MVIYLSVGVSRLQHVAKVEQVAASAAADVALRQPSCVHDFTVR